MEEIVLDMMNDVDACVCMQADTEIDTVKSGHSPLELVLGDQSADVIPGHACTALGTRAFVPALCVDARFDPVLDALFAGASGVEASFCQGLGRECVNVLHFLANGAGKHVDGFMGERFLLGGQCGLRGLRLGDEREAADKSAGGRGADSDRRRG